MSSRLCNYCLVQRLKQEAKKTEAKVHLIPSGGWTDVYLVPKGEKLDTSQDKKGNHISKQFRMSCLEVGQSCGC